MVLYMCMRMPTVWYALGRVCRQRADAPLRLRLPHLGAVTGHLRFLSLLTAAPAAAAAAAAL
jgi:hypothetical protein